jgi:hypothetical protein
MSAIGAEQDVIDRWVEARLEGQAAAFNALYAGLGTRIFDRFAPRGTTYPFIVYQSQSPARDVIGVGTARVLVESLYIVKAIAQTSTFTPLRSVAHQIDLCMTEEEGDLVADGAILVSVRQESFDLVEVENTNQFRHLGGMYRIQASVPA